MQHLGQILVLVSFALTAGTVALAVAGAARARPRLVRAAAAATSATAWVNVAVSLVLLHSIVVHDFSNRYVASYTDSGMPLFYLLTAFWGGEKGALLFWALSLSLIAAALVRARRGDGSAYFGWVVAIVAGALLFFDVLMVWASNPFEVFLTFDGPADGSGLNPLLQNPLMAVHPPFQLAGFVAYTIPFAFAGAALLDGRTDGSWIRESRRWYLLAWTLLTAGLIIGGLWAYLELGWGGFWGWDPVENAALLPWLTGTAMLHSAALERRRGMMRRWNFVLAFLTFILTIFATFLTRSQLIQSLHSFANSVLTPFFLDYMLLLVAGCALLLAIRWRALRPALRVERLWSREALVVANSVAFLLALFIVLWGTLLPKLSEAPVVMHAINAAIDLWNAAGGSALPLTKALDVGPEWFNQVVAPIGLAILGLTAVGPLVPLRSASSPVVRRSVGWTAVAAAATALVSGGAFVASRASRLADVAGLPFGEAVASTLRGLALPGIYGLLGVAFSAWVVFAVAVDVRGVVRVRRQVTREGIAAAAFGLFRANPGRFGGHLVHVGVALAFLGFSGAAGQAVRKDVVLKPLDRVSLAGHDLVFLGTREDFVEEGDYAALQSAVLAWPRGDPVPRAAADAVREGVAGVVAVRTPSPPEVVLAFGEEDDARRFYATAFARTVVPRDFRVAKVDRALQEVHLAPRQLETMRIVGRSFHRLVEELKGLSTALGAARMTMRMTPGDPLLVARFVDASLFKAFVAGLEAGRPPPYLAARFDPKKPLGVETIPAGVGLYLHPEMRFYARSENPTTEVDIEAGVLSDLYVASTPGEGSESMNLTAMVNPLMSGVWAGALVLVLSGFALVVPLPASRARRRGEGEGAG